MLALPGPVPVQPPTPPSDLGVIGRALQAPSLRVFARDTLTVIGREALFGADVFIKVFASILVMRAITHAAQQWWGSPEAWNRSEELLESFVGKKRAEPELPTHPQLVLEHMGYRFYKHNAIYQGQPMGPCPLRVVEPCFRCEWFVRGNDGRPYCAAISKLATAKHEAYGRLDIFEIRDLLRQEKAAGAASP